MNFTRAQAERRAASKPARGADGGATDASGDRGVLDAAREDMLLLVDFKWLMAGLGWWIDMARWRRDPGYARDCVVRGCSSQHAPLRECAHRLLARGLAHVM